MNILNGRHDNCSELKAQSVFQNYMPKILTGMIKTDLEEYVASLKIEDILLKDPTGWSQLQR